ncbi:hypothetical protein [Halorussus halophilus]|uniref:hypothetical protein n=1 Tax=Halorussus halophilus TaxID=2650975 RepID=UPI0013015A8E|nr:hypothetical protein [Halorussus halophilus]
MRVHKQARAPTRPPRATSTQAGFASVDHRKTQPKLRLVLASKPHARTGPVGRMPGLVGRERRGSRKRRAGVPERVIDLEGRDAR